MPAFLHRVPPSSCFAFALVLLLILVACPAIAGANVNGTTGRVIGGEKVGADDYLATWNSMVSIQYAGPEPARQRHACGGTLIAPRVVLTARHCVESSGWSANPDWLEVSSGAILGGGTRVAVTAIHRSPSSPGGMLAGGADIALLEIHHPVPYTTTSPLASTEHRSYWGDGAGRPDGVRVAGWGIARDADIERELDFGPIPHVLRSVELPVWDAQRCARRIKDSPALAASVGAGRYICAGVPRGTDSSSTGRSSCYGDSGGPLLATDPAGLEPPRVIGVVSQGTAMECAAGPGLYTAVDRHAAWIQAVIARVDGTRELQQVSARLTQVFHDSDGGVRFRANRAPRSREAYIGWYKPVGGRSWLEIGRFTGVERTLRVPPTQNGLAHVRLTYQDSGGVERNAGTMWEVETRRDAAPPAGIGRLNAVRRGHRIDLSWVGTTDRGDRVAGFYIQQRNGRRAPWSTEAYVDCAPCPRPGRAARSSHILLPGRRQFRIAAYDRAGNLGPWTISALTAARPRG